MNNENLRTRTLPRAEPKDVQEIVKRWREKHPGKDKGEYRAWCYLITNHWFPASQAAIDKAAEAGTIEVPSGPFVADCWCQEDVEKCRKALE